jgi:hypothetical protein
VYEDALYKYGVMTLCYLIKEFEKKERYEDCQMMVEVIRDHNLAMFDSLPTRYEDCEPYMNKALGESDIYGKLLREAPEFAREVMRALK